MGLLGNIVKAFSPSITQYQNAVRETVIDWLNDHPEAKADFQAPDVEKDNNWGQINYKFSKERYIDEDHTELSFSICINQRENGEIQIDTYWFLYLAEYQAPSVEDYLNLLDTKLYNYFGYSHILGWNCDCDDKHWANCVKKGEIMPDFDNTASYSHDVYVHANLVRKELDKYYQLYIDLRQFVMTGDARYLM